MTPKWIRLATLGIGLLWTYLLLVLSLGNSVLGFHVQLRYLAPAIVASFLGIYGVVSWVDRQCLVSPTGLKGLTVASIATLVSLLAGDIGYSVYLNLNAMGNPYKDPYDLYYLATDPHVSMPKGLPHRYFPTEKNFRIHKPNVTVKFLMYGDLYYPRLLDSPTVVNSVLKLRYILNSIDEHGFRESTPLKRAHIFALGDSFTYGVGTDQNETWVEVFERTSGEPTYNLGVSGNSLKQQLMILEYMLRTKPDTMTIRQLLWMIFEGNDLEDSFETLRPIQIQEKDTLSRLFDDTIIDTLTSIPFAIRNQSVLNRLKAKQVTFTPPFKDTGGKDPYVVDGTEFMRPLYYSKQYGYRLFYTPYIERVSESRSYVANHPHRPLLKKTFDEMASLSKNYGFKVTILIAPSAARLYGPYFEEFPSISREPHFINYVENLSHKLGFDVINLYRMMQPYAKDELLYWRDDSHWNERGHEVVADIISKYVTIAERGTNQETESE